ncbi:MAG TPA: aminoglycoside phosphotransferase family protein [Mycobacteriales bacterium]|nr:aminoglycoside phosphotransferase family protein [Mycobacteriales bacterium]
MPGHEEFLPEWHSRFAVTPSALQNFLRATLDSDAAAGDRIVGGYDNEVYRVVLEAGRPAYVRIRRPDDGDFTDEIRAMEWASTAGVPVPAVLATGDVEGRPAMILAGARGHPLADCEAGDRRAALLSLGRMLRRLHEVVTPGYWRPGPDDQWEQDAERLRRGFVADRAAERADLLAAGFTPAEIDRMITEISIPVTPPPRGPVLCHGDPTPEHIYVDERAEVVDVIDWGMWCGGWPVDDLAYMARTYSRSDLEIVLRGHGDSLADDEFRRRLWRTSIGQGIGHLAHHARIGDGAGVERNSGALRVALCELT